MNGGGLPDNKDLMKELLSIEYDFNNSNQVQIEKKKELKKRLGMSPDFADAFTMLFFRGTRHRTLNVSKIRRGRR